MPSFEKLRRALSAFAKYLRDLFVITFYIGLFMAPITAYAYFTEDKALTPLAKINAVLVLPGVLYYLFKLFSHYIPAFLRSILSPFIPSNIQVKEVEAKFRTTYGGALVFLSLTWIYLTLLFAYLYIYFGYSPIDSVFESMSGLTTSGLSVVSVSSLSPAGILFRSFTAWIGGIGILAFLLSTIRGITARIAAESFEIEGFNILSSVRKILATYLLLSLLSVALLLYVGFNLFESINLAMAGISNNGFYPFEGRELSTPQKDALALVMFLGSVNILIPFALVFKRDLSVLLRRDFLFYLFSIFSFALLLSPMAGWDLHTSLLAVLTTITGGGFGYMDFSEINDGVAFLLTGVMLTGAMAVSTGGGMKNTRVYALLKILFERISGLFKPENKVKVMKIKKRAVSVEEVADVALIPFSFLLLYFLSTLAFLYWGYSFRDATILSSTSLGNVGISTVDVAPMAEKEKALLILNMYFGRLEVIPAFALLLSFLGWKR